MAHIPEGDIREIWSELPAHNWSALHQTLEAHLNKAEGIDNELVQVMIKMTDHFEKSQHAFPMSERQLYDLFNQNLARAESR